MIEHEPLPTVAVEGSTRPPYEQMSAGLEQLLDQSGWTVKDGFPEFLPKGAMASSDYVAKTLTLHPWIAPRVRTETLMQATVTCLAEQRATKRGNTQKEAVRQWLVQGLVGRCYGMATDTSNVSAVASWEPNPAEEALIVRMVEAIDAAGSASHEPESNGGEASGTVFEAPKPKRSRAPKKPTTGDDASSTAT